MLIDLISCSHFLVATVFMNACRDIWWLSIERQQNIAQLVVKTCRNHHSAVRQSYSLLLNACRRPLFFYIKPPFILFFVRDSVGASQDSYQVTVDPNIILTWLKLIRMFFACISPDMKSSKYIYIYIFELLSELFRRFCMFRTFLHINYFRHIFYMCIWKRILHLHISGHNTCSLILYMVN